MTEFEVDHTHLFPGARGRALSEVGDGPALLRFADGVTAAAELQEDRLSVAAHRTAAGTGIPAKAWRIAVEAGRLQVLGRA